MRPRNAAHLHADTDIRSYGKCYDDFNTLFTYYNNCVHVAFVGDFNAWYLEPVHGYTQIQKTDYLLSCSTNNVLIAINKTDICSRAQYTFEPTKATPDYVLVAPRTVNSIKLP